MTDLSTYSLADLRKLLDQIQQQINSRQVEEQARARQEILAIAESAGIKLSTLFSKKTGASKTKTVPALYRNPANEAQQWSGRGRQPAWFLDLVKGGKTKDELRIQKKD